jgi:hypothetical protein
MEGSCETETGVDEAKNVEITVMHLYSGGWRQIV